MAASSSASASTASYAAASDSTACSVSAGASVCCSVSTGTSVAGCSVSPDTGTSVVTSVALSVLPVYSAANASSGSMDVLTSNAIQMAAMRFFKFFICSPLLNLISAF